MSDDGIKKRTLWPGGDGEASFLVSYGYPEPDFSIDLSEVIPHLSVEQLEAVIRFAQRTLEVKRRQSRAPTPDPES